MGGQLKRIHQLIYLIIVLAWITKAQEMTCYSCDTLNRQTTEQCIGTEEDCDNCMDGFQEVSWTTFCAPSDTVVIDQYQNATVLQGGTVLLRCQFENTVDCVWQRNGILHLDINNRYKYIDSSNSGVSTSECSILIEQFCEEDHGQWECKSMADSENVAVKMSDVWLHSEASVIESPENTTVSMGETAVLKCQFDTAAQCFWMKNDVAIDIDTEVRYKYVSTDPSSCSIEIQQVEDGDIGEWKCGGQFPSGNNIMASSVWIATSPKDVPEEEEEEASIDIILISVLAIVGTVLVATIIAIAVIVSRRRNKAEKHESIEIYELDERPSMRPMLKHGLYSSGNDDEEIDKKWNQTMC